MLGATPYPAGRAGVRRPPQDARDAGRGGRARARLAAAAAGGQLRAGRRGRARARPADRRTAISEPARACSAAPAGCAASATSAATTAPRTPSTTRTCPPPSTTAPTCAPAHEVGRIRPRAGGGYVVAYLGTHSAAGRPSRRRSPVPTITCDRLILAAGTFGTTYLLLRNRPTSPASAQRAGHPVLRQRRPADLPVHAKDRGRLPAAGRQPRAGHHQRHPAARRTRRRRPGRGAYIEDGGYPGVRGLAGRGRRRAGRAARGPRTVRLGAVARLRDRRPGHQRLAGRSPS